MIFNDSGLDDFFLDRRARKIIKESVYNARDLNEGVCQCCNNIGKLLRVSNYNLCESCCESLLDTVDENYDTQFISEDLNSNIESILSINEAGMYVLIGDINKFSNDIVTKFGGDINKLMASYNLPHPKNFDAKLQGENKLWIAQANVGNINHFIDDYQIEFGRQGSLDMLNPDSDGYVATYRKVGKWKRNRLSNAAKAAMNGTGTSMTQGQVNTPVASPKSPTVASVNATANTSAANAAANTTNNTSTTTKTISGSNYKGDIDKVEINVSGTVITVTRMGFSGNSTMAGANGNGSNDYSIECGGNKVSVKFNGLNDVKDLVERVKKYCAEHVTEVFPAFEGETLPLEINVSDVYKFVVKPESFGSKFTVFLYYNGKERNATFNLSGKALISKATLRGELEKGISGIIEKNYPILFGGLNKIKTSIGIVSFNFDGFSTNIATNGKMVPYVTATIGGVTIRDELSANADLWSDKNLAGYTFKTIILNHMGEIIKGFDDSNLKVASKKNEYSYDIKFDGEYYTLIAYFIENSFLDLRDGNIAFQIILKNNRTGQSGKNADAFIYKRVGTKLEDFFKRCAKELYDKHFSKSNMTKTLTASANEKMTTPSKREALFGRIADKFAKVVGFSTDKKFKDLEVSFAMSVNKDAMMTDGIITIKDYYGDIADTSDELLQAVSDTLKPYNKILAYQNNTKKSRDGASITFKVVDIEAFSNLIELYLIEDMIREAFGLPMINEGRKVINV